MVWHKETFLIDIQKNLDKSNWRKISKPKNENTEIYIPSYLEDRSSKLLAPIEDSEAYSQELLKFFTWK